MATAWSADELQRIGSAGELEIAVSRADGTRPRWVPIWVVRAGEQVYVRSWHRRDTGWFGQALRSRQAGIRVPGLTADVTIDDIGTGPAPLRAEVDAAYRAKYGEAGAASMVTEAAAATTLRLSRP
ncbi:DUF2255 family protein [Actinoplanes sp. NPDC026619]|uniref:DUF2255 family protein n=1 Tax=Actinoplanes sp. NPDC026619 TaxID=3155798 RepID=UPI0033EC17E9